MKRSLTASAFLLLAVPGFAQPKTAIPEDPALVERVGAPLRDELLDRMAAWRGILFPEGTSDDAVSKKYGATYAALELRAAAQLHPGDIARTRFEWQKVVDDALKERHKIVKSAGVQTGGFDAYKTSASEAAERVAVYRRESRAAGDRARTAMKIEIPEIPTGELTLSGLPGAVLAVPAPPTTPSPDASPLPLPSRSMSLSLATALARGPASVKSFEPPPPSRDESSEFYLDVPAAAAKYEQARSYLLSRGAQAEVVDATIAQALKKGVNPLIPLAVCMQESGCSTVEKDKKTGKMVPVTSDAGAVGPFQIMPDMHGASEAELRHTPTNVSKGIGLLVYLNKKFNDFELTLAGYNAGEGAVQKAGGVPRYGETQDFVKKVSANVETLRQRLKDGVYRP